MENPVPFRVGILRSEYANLNSLSQDINGMQETGHLSRRENDFTGFQPGFPTAKTGARRYIITADHALHRQTPVGKTLQKLYWNTSFGWP